MLTTYQRVMDGWRRPVIDDRTRCLCGHTAPEHSHHVAECFACDCPLFTDANDLEGRIHGDD